jgi:hypothetical protein
MSNIRIALYLFLLGVVYAVAAKLDQTEQPAVQPAAGQSATSAHAPPVPDRAEKAAAASNANAACRVAC